MVECGFLRATTLEPAEALYAGEVGYIAASIKDVRQARVGDTVTLKERPAAEPLEGYPGRCSHGCSAASTPPMAPTTPICGTLWKSSN